MRRRPSSTSRTIFCGAGGQHDVAGAVGVGGELAAGLGGEHQVAVLGHGVGAAGDVVGSGPQLAHLAQLRLAVHGPDARTDGVVAARLLDLGGHAEGLHGDRGALVYLGALGELLEHESLGLLEIVGDEDLDAVCPQGGRGPIQPFAARRRRELAVRDQCAFLCRAGS